MVQQRVSLLVELDSEAADQLAHGAGDLPVDRDQYVASALGELEDGVAVLGHVGREEDDVVVEVLSVLAEHELLVGVQK